MWRVAVLITASVLLTGCAALSSGQSEREQLADVNRQLGVEYLRQGNLEQANERLTRAVSQDPRNAAAHGAYALLNERLNEPDLADQHYRRAIRLDGQASSILNNYGRFLCSRGQSGRGLEMFERAADNPLYGTPEVPLTNAGLCLDGLGDAERAEDYFLRALGHNARFAPALLRMAELREAAGHPMSARGFYQRYLEVARQSAETLWLGIRIERALGDRDAVASYALQLRTRFPDSDETRKLLESDGDQR